MKRQLLLTIIVAVIVATAAGLSLDQVTDTRGQESSKHTPNNVGKVHLQGEGSSFLFPQIQAWSAALKERHPWIVVSYNPTGSGSGQSALLSGVVDFAGSDPPLSREAWEQLRGRVLQMPVVIGMVAVVYNLPGVGELRLDGETLARIFSGEVEYWDDEVIRRHNQGVDLPHERIIVVHRSDSSGTTEVLTRFLRKSAPHVWGDEMVGKSVDWPVDRTGRGVGAKGNQGVLEMVLRTRYSIGYVEYAYALDSGVGVARVMNRAGNFIAPSPQAAQEAARAALGVIPESPLGDWSGAFDAIVYAPGEGSYPLTSWSFLLFHTNYPDEGKEQAVRTFIEWLNTEGQEHIVEGYVPIPPEVRQVNLKALDQVSAG